AFCLIRLPPFRRPFPPRPLEAVAQRFETGEVRQQGAALDAELLETLAAFGARARLETLEGRSQRAPLQASDPGIIDISALPQPRQRFAIGACAIFRDRLDVDVERVEEHPAVRRIGAAIG